MMSSSHSILLIIKIPPSLPSHNSQDSLVFGGNFLHGFHMKQQIAVRACFSDLTELPTTPHPP